MQLGLLALLGGLILLATFCYWLGFRARPRPAWAWHAQAGFLVTSLVLIPTAGFTLYFQRTAPDRVRAELLRADSDPPRLGIDRGKR